MYSVAKPKRFNIKTFLFLFFASPKEKRLFQYVFFAHVKKEKISYKKRGLFQYVNFSIIDLFKAKKFKVVFGLFKNFLACFGSFCVRQNER